MPKILMPSLLGASEREEVLRARLNPPEKMERRAGGPKVPNTMDSNGRIMIRCPDHPFPTNGKYVYRYRLVMEAHLGRYLLPKEHIHHINMIRDDDRLENLMVVSEEEHKRLHARKIAFCSCQECQSEAKVRGMCEFHYRRSLKGRIMDAPKWKKRIKPKIFTPTKSCRSCGVEQPRTSDYFGLVRINRDGLAGTCNACRRIKIATYRLNRGETKKSTFLLRTLISAQKETMRL